MFPHLFLQFDDDKDDGGIEKVEVMSRSEVKTESQTMKTENEGKTIRLCCRSTFFICSLLLVLLAP